MSGIRLLAGVVLGLVSVVSAGAATPTVAPQLLPYTVSVVVGGGPYTGAGTTTKPTPFTVGQSCGAGSTLTATDTYGDGCLATQVTVVTPRAVATDSQGNVYLVDAYNYLIRRVDSRTGILTAYAGGAASSPGAGASCGTGSTMNSTDAFGDGCLATQVSLAAPEGLTVDAQDNVWFTDYTLGSVREVTKATGIITTIVNTAGTLGYKAGNVADPGVVVTAAQGLLDHPYGLAFDNNGNLYIADNYNNLVDAVNLGTNPVTIAGVSIPAGAIYTIAGSGCTYVVSSAGCGSAYGKTNGVSTSSLLDSPYQVAVDNSGNIYIADEYPYDVRVINTSGTMSVYANSAYTKSATIARGPAVSTSLASTFGVATDAYGNVYIGVYDATTSSSYIDRVDVSSGIIYPVAGQAVTAAPANAAPLVAGTGATYCTQKTDAVGDGCPGTMSSLYKPYQPFVDGVGNVYIADQGNALIRKVSVGTQFPAAGQAVGASATQSLQVHFSAGDTQGTYAINNASVDFTLGAATCTTNSDTTQDCVLPVTFKPTAAGIRTAPLLIKSASGLVSTFSLTGTGLAAVLAVDPGTQATLASTGVTGVGQIAVGQAGNTYAVVPGSASIVKISPTGAQSNVGTGLTGATSVAVDAMGNVYAALSSGTVMEVPASGAAQTAIGSGFTKPTGVAADSLGNLYVVDSAANTVSEISPKTGVQRIIATAASAGLSGPNGLAVDASGNVFIANTIANNVVEIPFAGGAAIALGSGLSAPAAVATGPAGAVYVADTRNGRVVFLPNENGKISTADQLTVVSGLTAPSGVAVAATAVLAVADGSANAVYTYTRTAGMIAFGNVATGTQVTSAADIVSVGNQAVTFGSPYYTATGNTTDFNLTPGTLSSGTTLASGFGVALTAGFKPTTTGNRSAAYSFASTNATAPTLNLTGVGITPVDATTTTLTVNPGSGTYGQTETITVTVAAGAGVPVPTGTVTVKVDTTTYMPMLAGGTVTFQVAGLSAGSHTVTAMYTGDTNSSPSTATPVTFMLAQAPLTITVNNASKAYGAVIPTLTGTLTGVVNNDQIGVTYSTTATQTSALGTYPITATVVGSAANNYSVTVKPGVLTVTQAATNTTVSASSYSVQSATSVTLTAVVASTTSGTPTGTVTFLNGTTVIAANVPLVAGSAKTVTTFPAGASGTTNSVTVMYSGDTNFVASTSPAITIVSSYPGFSLTGTTTTLTVAKGQTGLGTFTITPTFGYVGTVNFSCTGLPATIGCTFSPASIAADGTNTVRLVAFSLTTTQAGLLAEAKPPVRGDVSPVAFAGVLLLAGGLLSRRKLRLAMKHLVLLAVLAMVGIGLAGCGTARSTAGTPTGAYVVTIIATGSAPAGATTTIAQQFTVTLNVQ